MPYQDLSVFAPELWLCGLALLVLVLDLLLPRRAAWLSAAAALVGLVVCARPVLDLLGAGPASEFMGSVAVDGFAVTFKLLFLACGVFVILLSVDFFTRSEAYGEYFSLVVFLVLGMCLLSCARDLILIYLSFELVSLTSYLLVAWRKTDPKSNEAGVKYFIFGAAASAVMLYGLTLVYGAGGSTNLGVIAENLMEPQKGGGLALVAVLGLLMTLAGMGYKISMVPFHFWAPDVYEGAPTPVTALLSVGPKAAGLALLFRFFYDLEPAIHFPWQVVVAMLAVVTMFAGNLLALRQTNIKRMLAYSSIAHAGYLLIGFVVGPGELWGIPGVVVYLVAYLLMNMGLFAVAIAIERSTGSSDIDRFAGLARTAPGLSAVTLILLLSLTGIPPTAGFVGKLYIFGAAIQSHQWAWLAVVGIVNSVISLYYYMNIARLMYFDKRPGSEITGTPLAVRVTVFVTGLGTVALCLAPDWLIRLAQITSLSH